MWGDYEQPELYLERAAEVHIHDLARLPSAEEVEQIGGAEIPWLGPTALRILTIKHLPSEVRRDVQRRAARTYYRRHSSNPDFRKRRSGRSKSYAEMTDEQREARRVYMREYSKKRVKRINELSEEEREARRVYQRAYDKKRVVQHRDYQRARAARMTEEEKEARRLYYREYYRRRHAKATNPVPQD